METTKTADAAEDLLVKDASDNETEIETAEEAAAEDAHELDDADDLDELAGHEPAEPVKAASTGVLAGAAAVIAAGLGLSSLTGTWIADLMAERQNIIVQAAGTATTTNEQIAKLYGTPWHTTALFNGFFAIAAILVAAVVLLAAKSSPTWVRALAWGGLAVGVIGLFIAGVMWFDVFTDIPQVAQTATTSSSTG
jgi:hypothetical protein